MLLTVTTTGTPERPATDLGFLLHKHPDGCQAFSTSHGTAHVFYPEAAPGRCTAALLLEVDPVALVRRSKGPGGSPDPTHASYVNDRPYAATSLLAVALARVFSSALSGRCKAMPERAAQPLPLRIEVPSLSARGGPELVRALFAPLGWTVTATPVPLDERFPEWGDSRCVDLVLEGTEHTLGQALRHLYVLMPVLDDAKHYWVSPDEVDKLLRAGEGWLAAHPEQQVIVGRYLSHRGPWRVPRWNGWRWSGSPRATAPGSRRSTTPSTRPRTPRRSPCRWRWPAGRRSRPRCVRAARRGSWIWAAVRDSWCRPC